MLLRPGRGRPLPLCKRTVAQLQLPFEGGEALHEHHGLRANDIGLGGSLGGHAVQDVD